jgi:sec-independent protein translocase protein TatC
MGEIARLLAVVSEVRRRSVRIALVLLPIFGFLVTFRLQTFSWALGPVHGVFAYPLPDLFNNVTAQVFRALVGWILPPGVVLLNLGVGDSILVQVEIGLLLTVIVGMPWIAHELGAFLMPALRRSERELLLRVGIPATLLFATGTAIGLFVLTPLTYRLLFRYVAAMGLDPVLGVQQFVLFTLLYSLAFGVIFELPVFLYALTRLGIVRAATWQRHWRAAVVGSLVFGMLITPDNSGITMLLIAGPMIGLYLTGAWFARRTERRLPATANSGA